MSLAFSADSSFLAAQGGAPEWNLAVWQWEKSRLAGTAKGTNQVRQGSQYVLARHRMGTMICAANSVMGTHTADGARVHIAVE